MNDPVLLNMLVGGTCRLRCPFCSAWRKEFSQMSVKGWSKAFEELSDWLPGRRLVLSGGEPLRHPDMELIVRSAHEYGFPAGISTSGEPFDDDLVRSMATWPIAGLDLSIDGLEATHDALRGRQGLFRRVLDAVDYLKCKRPELIVSTISVINAANVGELDELTDFLIDKPQIDRVGFQAIVHIESAERLSKPTLLPLWPRQKQVEAFLSWLARRRETTSKIGNSRTQINLWRQYFQSPLGVFETLGSCHVRFYTLSIRPDGDITLCDRRRSVGNILDRSIREIWQSADAQALREEMGHCRIPCNHLINCSFEDYHLHLLSEDERTRYFQGKSEFQ